MAPINNNINNLYHSAFFPVPEPIIRFSEIKYSVREPQVKGSVALVKIPILRLGDTSKVSMVRVHTKDGSATSGEDYNPLSEGKDTAHWLNPATVPMNVRVHFALSVSKMLSSRRVKNNTLWRSRSCTTVKER